MTTLKRQLLDDAIRQIKEYLDYDKPPVRLVHPIKIHHLKCTKCHAGRSVHYFEGTLTPSKGHLFMHVVDGVITLISKQPIDRVTLDPGQVFDLYFIQEEDFHGIHKVPDVGPDEGPW